MARVAQANPLTNTAVILLLLLQSEEALTSTELVARMNARGHGCPAPARNISALKRLLHRGLLHAELRRQRETRGIVYVYSLMPRGRAEARRMEAVLHDILFGMSTDDPALLAATPPPTSASAPSTARAPTWSAPSAAALAADWAASVEGDWTADVSATYEGPLQQAAVAFAPDAPTFTDTEAGGAPRKSRWVGWKRGLSS